MLHHNFLKRQPIFLAPDSDYMTFVSQLNPITLVLNPKLIKLQSFQISTKTIHLQLCLSQPFYLILPLLDNFIIFITREKSFH